ncbi:uroporphyrinogen-III C-methyltransferase [Methylomarinum sp. Ch1-1]|uniref:Uroporphyrinogen-III C-methyltransferase n=1 Tax=Methylomarinum roseum TaxID=3067653 RepID=A0AAU7NY54_9GAMM|nr:uroporphyrinogen-III C-methyltransferase [Methylomarinum sp. Ch1-1]MDP4521990.1 uroporphyrinogen-III C-methyltransferase [Methylomarinum sp. Ch1-1]
MAEVIEEQETQPAAQAQVEVKKSRAGLWFGVIMTLCIVVLAGAGFYLLQQLREHQDALSSQDELKLIEVSKQMNAFQSQLAAMQSQLATVDADVTGKEAHFNKKLEEFSDLHIEKLESTRKQLQESILHLQRQLGKTRGDWLIADAEYLLSVANQRLHLVGDLNTTREALEAADQRLRESGDASVYKVREQIAKELAALKTVQVPDIVGIYSTLQLLKEKVDNLAVFLPYAGKDLTPSKQIHEHKIPSEEGHDFLSAIFGQLEGYVTLRHTDQPVKEILTPEEAQFIKDQLGVKLEMIKIALVQQNDTLYKTAIADAKRWLNENFSQNNDAQSFAAELERLNNIEIRAHFPDISASLKMLRDIGKLRLENDKAMQNDREQPAEQPNSAQ